MVLLTFISMLFICWLIHQFYLRRRGLPPGPIPLPLIGNFHQIDLRYPHRTMVKWRKIYGGIYTVWLPKPTVILADFSLIKEALTMQGNVFSGRPMSFVYGIFSNHQKDGGGIILSQNKKWSQQRRFALKVFRDFGMGTNLMETKIRYHCDQLIQLLHSNICPDKPLILDLHSPFAFCIGNIIQDIVLGQTSSYGDAKFQHFKELLDKILRDFVSVEMLMIDSYPWLRYILPKYGQYVKNGFTLQNFFLEKIAEHESNLTSDDEEPRNFMDAYIKYMKMKTGSCEYDRVNLALNSGDLWTGGMETTVTTLLWAIIYLIHEPKIQERIYNEIHKAISLKTYVLGSKQVTWSDRGSMPFTLAFIYELQRIINILPWHIPHSTTASVTFHNYPLPENITILPSVGAVHFDEEIFPDPERFIPNRFLNEHGGLRRIEEFIPFGIGRRSCLGEPLARMELFIILPTLVQHFRFSSADEYPSLERSLGMTSVPLKYDCSIEARQNVNTVQNESFKLNE